MKTLTTVIVGLFFFSLSGCAAVNDLMGTPLPKGNGYPIEHIEKSNMGRDIYIEYQDRAFLEAETRKRMANRMASENETQKAVAALPSGGRIIVTMTAHAVEAANTKWLEYVALANGQEILREKGENKIANLPSTNGLWWNTDIVAIPMPITESMDFVVINTLRTRRDVFRISTPQPQ